MTRLAFHRPARLMPTPLPDGKIALPNPPVLQGGQNPAAIITLLMPVLGSVGMAAYMISFGRPIMIVIGIIFILVSLVTVVAMRSQFRSSARRSTRRQRVRFKVHLTDARRQARSVGAAQRNLAIHSHPEPERLFAIAATYERVWERRPADPDFLRIRIGTGEAELATPIQLGAKTDPLADYDWESMRLAKRLVARLGRVDGQPTVVNLADCGVLSILGPRRHGAAVARAILCQVAVLHAPDDVGIAIEMSGAPGWEWTKWLPHTFEPQVRGDAGVVPLVAAGPSGLSDFLERELLRRHELWTSRRNQIGLDRNTMAAQQRLIVVFTGFEPVSEWGRSELMRTLLDATGPALGITLVFLTAQESDEPSRVDLRIRLTDNGRPCLTLEGRGELVVARVDQCLPDVVDARLAELIARRMSPLRLSDEREQILSRVVSLTEMVLGGDPMTADVTARWVEPTDQRLLRAPIGTDGEGAHVILDIKESAQGGSGPHGLIVGATGSGKSELLRTLIAGLALTHSPDVLSFVLVDFKGGAAFAPMIELPHVAGLITNLADDHAMIDRAQAALQGEQQRRQQILRRAGNLDSVRQYQKLWADGTPGADGQPLEPLPYLLIIVDEFGELLTGRPEFTDLFVQIGRVGRSLGMHLLLATQRLEEGRLRGLDSHLSYRICLRTFSAIESRTVIGTTDAYRLPPIPGSAYLKVDESIYQRFRVAHVSAPYGNEKTEEAIDPESMVKPYELRRRGGEGARTEDSQAANDDAGPTELSIMVDRLKTVGPPVHQVWLPRLPPAIPLDHLLGEPAVAPGRGLCARTWPMLGELKVPLGVVDMPLQQDQQPLVMDFGGPHGNLIVVGAPQSGRSTMLRTLMVAGMLTNTPDEIQFYCIDFGGGTLHPYADAPHVCAVAGRADRAMVNRILVEVHALIGAREAMLRSLGIDSIVEFRSRRDAGALPDGVRGADVFLLIDNWSAVRSEMDDVEPVVTEIAARGLGSGVHVVLASNRWMEIRPALKDSFGTRIELHLNDPTESDISRRLAAQMPAKMPGRGIAPPGAYFQLALPRLDGRETTDELRGSQEDVLSKIAAAWSGSRAPRVRLLPERILTSELEAMPVTLPGVPVGLGEVDLRPVMLDLIGGDPHLIIFGDAGSGKSSFLRTWMGGLVRRHSAWEVRIVLVDYRRTLLGAVPPDHLGAYAGDGETASGYVASVAAKLRERLPPSDVTPEQLRARSWWDGPDIYVVIDDYDLVIGGGTPSPIAPLAEFVPHARDIGFHLVIARRVTGSGRSLFSDQVVMRMRELGCNGLVLSGDTREGVLIGDEKAAARPPGRGVLIRRGHPRLLIHVASDDDRDALAASAGRRA